MKTSSLLITIITICIHTNTQAQQTSSCTNADFELNNFSNWIGRTGDCCPVNTTQPGIVTGRHTIMSGPGFDPNSNSLIPLVAPGGQFSARLGNDNVGAEAEQLSYSFLVTSSTALFIYRYAVVLEDPGHSASNQPRFSIRVFDQNNQPLSCGTYDVVASANIPGFVSNGSLRIKPWTTIGVELSSYIGQYVTIEFTTADCGVGGHFGYAYIDCFCSPFTISSDLCPGSNTITLNAPTGFSSYLWSNGDTLPAVVLNNPIIGSTYTCTMTSVSGCQVTLQTVINPTVINANFYTTMNCTNETRFIDSSAVITGTPIQQWHWDFGDGNVSTEHYPVHQYTTPGNYTIQLIVFNSNCSDTITKNITVIPSPQSDFTFLPQCPGDPVPFTDQSVFTAGTIISHLWDFGDASPLVTIINPSHAYNSPGPFQVNLDIEASNGCRDRKTQLLSVVLQPQAVFNYVPNCDTREVIFTNDAASTCGPVIAYQWDFGDGSPISTVENPTHTYSATGVYNVTYTVTTWNGISGTGVTQIIVPEKPIANFNADATCEKLPTLFNDQSQIALGTLTSWEWNFGNGSYANGSPQVQHLYNEQGLYDAMLKVTSNFNCVDSITKQITIWDSPQASFQAALLSGCEPLEVPFHSTSISNDGNISGYEWDFGNATFDTIQSPIRYLNPTSLIALQQ
jgi:PKD repeat protein